MVGHLKQKMTEMTSQLDSIADEMFKELLNNMTVEHDSCDGSSQVFPEDPALS